LELLRDLYGRVLIPESVAEEIRIGERRQIYKPFLSTTDWIEVRKVTHREQVVQLLSDLDLGEAEAIALCLEVGAHLLLVDERIGRNTATRKGIKTVGLLGSLVACKARGLIPAVRPVIEDLRDLAGFWVRDALMDEVLRAAGEN
jgi:predicted nucleic acid-binding protein